MSEFNDFTFYFLNTTVMHEEACYLRVIVYIFKMELLVLKAFMVSLFCFLQDGNDSDEFMWMEERTF